MKRSIIRLFSASALLLSFSTYAHDASEHMKGGQKPDCSTLHQSKRNRSDPVMQAMMKKCMKGMNDDSTQSEEDAVARNILKSETK